MYSQAINYISVWCNGIDDVNSDLKYETCVCMYIDFCVCHLVTCMNNVIGHFVAMHAYLRFLLVCRLCVRVCTLARTFCVCVFIYLILNIILYLSQNTR